MDLEYAMNPGGRRRFQNKEQATYGVFAPDHDSDDDEQSTSKGPANKRQKYTTPLNFVSGGVQKGSKVDKTDPESLNLGTYSSKAKDDEDEAIELNFDRRTKRQEKQQGAQVFAGMRSSATKGTAENQFGGWMKHGKSDVIMKMMQSMGYKAGEGLGAKGQGIVEPVTAAVRKGRGAVGAYGKEASSAGPKFGESAADAQKRMAQGGNSTWKDGEEQEKTGIKIKGGWKKSQKVKTTYKTIDDIMEEGMSATRPTHQQSQQYSNIKVIDMTGKQQKVYSGYDSFSMKTRSQYDTVDEEERTVFDVPELLHNLNLLVDMTEEGIRRSNQQLISLKDQTTALEFDLGQVQKALTTEEQEVQHIKDVFELIDGFSANRSPSMEECQSLFRRLRSEFPHEYQLYSLETVAIPTVLPLIQRHFAIWNPLQDKNYGCDLISEWRDILDDSKNGKKATFGHNKTKGDEIRAYDRIIWEGILPSIRRACLQWDPRTEMHEMIELVEQWIPLLSAWITENILEQLIIPKITERVNQWDPMTDEVPIHQWLVPWLVLLGDRIQTVMPPIRQKLSKALKLWDPMDRSAMATLRPWKDVWSSGTFSAFVGQNIIPKLGAALDTMELNPTINPEYPEWAACMEWLEMTHPDAIANIVTKYFFPRFYNVLCIWLDSPGVDYNEVKRWYMAWKSRIPQEIVNYPTIQENLRRSMIAFGKSNQGHKVSGLPSAPIAQMAPTPSAPMSRFAPTNQQLSLKEIIEITACKNGFTYHPQKDRYKDGRQVFWFGALSIYIDSEMVYVMDPMEFVWRSTGLNELIQMAQGAQG
ncbi:CBN-STIP-1 protein [Caenorhabditis brenneri]|uniref:Septin and tuftelin-interacting protein 1 homolog n=1 Tax=Caenorhabditis brenneri TaxID=135651 RepID=G0NR46_CAEBE|nr:CBN-STIP-1 protein [Caenorhabditis brenneri]